MPFPMEKFMRVKWRLFKKRTVEFEERLPVKRESPTGKSRKARIGRARRTIVGDYERP